MKQKKQKKNLCAYTIIHVDRDYLTDISHVIRPHYFLINPGK